MDAEEDGAGGQVLPQDQVLLAEHRKACRVPHDRLLPQGDAVLPGRVQHADLGEEEQGGGPAASNGKRMMRAGSEDEDKDKDKDKEE